MSNPLNSRFAALIEDNPPSNPFTKYNKKGNTGKDKDNKSKNNYLNSDNNYKVDHKNYRENNKVNKIVQKEEKTLTAENFPDLLNTAPIKETPLPENSYIEKVKIQEYGSEVKIKRVLKTHDNGGMDILIEATSLFRLVEFSKILKPKLYGAGIIESVNTHQTIKLNNLQDATVNYFGTVQNKMIDYDTVSRLTIYNVASALQLTYPEKYKLIASPNQQIHLLGMIKFIVHIINTENQIKNRFIEN
jgi:hypothetical protein